jgi:proteasome lid subunit RPN8/RPN11
MITAKVPTLPPEIRDRIEEHVFAETEREVGGVLVGHLTDGEATVEAAIPALKATEGAMNVTFTHEVWADVLDTVERDHPGRRIVGWYHSHPGFGLFLSEYDSFIQANFFAEPGMLALVVDPLAGELGWFTWADGAVRELGTGPTARAAIARASDVQVATSARRRTTLQAIVGAFVLAGVAGVAGYAFGSLSNPPVTVVSAGQAPTTASPNGPTGSEAQPNSTDAQLQAALKRVAELEGATTTSITYTVRRGDNWWSISQALTGRGSSFQALIDANPAQLGKLNPGDVITVPNVPVPPSATRNQQ